MRIDVKNFGPIKEANLTLKDLTVFTGPQASGKTMLLQLIKILKDANHTKSILKLSGFDCKDENELFQLYFGEGTGSICWSESSELKEGGKSKGKRWFYSNRTGDEENVFYIPAQRVLTLQNGWPRNFLNYDIGDPFVVKNFSEQLRQLMEQGFAAEGAQLFPQDRRIKKVFRDRIDETIFHGATVKLDRSSLKKRIVLNVQNEHLPFMNWSAGQREFLPLLLGLYRLMPSSGSTKNENIDYVIIEEPEMGLHPSALQSLVLLFLELVHRGYKVIVSTHSTVLLETIWAVNAVRECCDSSNALFDLFNLSKSPTLRTLFDSIIEDKDFSTYFFSQSENGVTVKDISTLDPFAEDSEIAEWGGLSSFSSRASDVVSSVVAEANL